MRPESLAIVLLAVAASAQPSQARDAEVPDRVGGAESAFLEYLDAQGALGVVESGLVGTFHGADRRQWQDVTEESRTTLKDWLARIDDATLAPQDAHAVRAMRHTLESLFEEDTPAGAADPSCRDARESRLGYARLRAALVACYVEYGNAMRFEGGTIDRSSALQLLHVMDEPARRRAVFDAFLPLWEALYGKGGSDSPYRRMIAMAAEDAARNGSRVDAAARALGLSTADVEQWLVEILGAWRDATGPERVEPWDYRYANSTANRELAEHIPAASLLPINERYYKDLGVDLAAFGVIYDLAPRDGKSPIAYADFVSRGRAAGAEWNRSTARVVGTYPTGGLYSLNELVHENGHAAHIAAIRNRPAYMDWPDDLFTEAFADVPSWSVYEPAWQRRYLGQASDEPAALRALFGDVMLDIAWGLFELRMLRDPRQDPNALWTQITSEYLHVVPHPEWPWWAVRVQLVEDPGYMINYGLGAVLTAEMRRATAAEIGAFETPNPAWYEWLSDRLLRYGSERDTRALMQGLLGRPVSPAALLSQVARCREVSAAAREAGATPPQ